MHERVLPGKGCGDTAGFVKLIRDKGVDPKVVGVEVINDEILASGVANAAKLNFEATQEVLKARLARNGRRIRRKYKWNAS